MKTSAEASQSNVIGTLNRLLIGRGLVLPVSVRLRMCGTVFCCCSRCRCDWRILQNVGDDGGIVGVDLKRAADRRREQHRHTFGLPFQAATRRLASSRICASVARCAAASFSAAAARCASILRRLNPMGGSSPNDRACQRPLRPPKRTLCGRRRMSVKGAGKFGP